jgi:hypothetical protein
MKDLLKITIAVGIVYLCLSLMEKKEEEVKQTAPSVSFPFELVDENTPPCLQMHYYIQKYAKEYNVPLPYAYGIANCETAYKGPFHWKYNPAQTSCVGAVGPMQVMPSTAEWVWKKDVSTKQLREDVRFNVETSMKYLQYLHGIYKDWKTVFGCYNTGRPCVNNYAIKVYNYKPIVQ